MTSSKSLIKPEFVESKSFGKSSTSGRADVLQFPPTFFQMPDRFFNLIFSIFYFFFENFTDFLIITKTSNRDPLWRHQLTITRDIFPARISISCSSLLCFFCIFPTPRRSLPTSSPDINIFFSLIHASSSVTSYKNWWRRRDSWRSSLRCFNKIFNDANLRFKTHQRSSSTSSSLTSRSPPDVALQLIPRQSRHSLLFSSSAPHHFDQDF